MKYIITSLLFLSLFSKSFAEPYSNEHIDSLEKRIAVLEKKSKEKPKKSSKVNKETEEEIDYRNKIDIYELKSVYNKDNRYNEKLPYVTYKVKNTGTESVEYIVVTVYFKDETGNNIFEKIFKPLSKFKPLKGGYINKGGGFSVKDVPSEWKEGSVEAKVTLLKFKVY